MWIVAKEVPYADYPVETPVFQRISGRASGAASPRQGTPPGIPEVARGAGRGAARLRGRRAWRFPEWDAATSSRPRLTAAMTQSPLGLNHETLLAYPCTAARRPRSCSLPGVSFRPSIFTSVAMRLWGHAMIAIRGTVTVLDPTETDHWERASMGTAADEEPEPAKEWSAPAVEILELGTARGAHAGSMCDRFGSLSHGGACQ